MLRSQRGVALPSTESRASARKRLAAELAAVGIDTPDLDARLLVCAAAGIDHAGLIREPDLPLDEAGRHTLSAHAARRLAREPVSRILGRREFWGVEVAVAPAVLDPRPETEGLVASVLDAVGGRRATPLSVLDLGVGSGALLGALLRELPAAWGLGIDCSLAACRVARANFGAFGVRDRGQVLVGDWGTALEGRFDVVVSNPPYIRSGDLAGLAAEVRVYDPPAALDGGADGLDAYRAILPGLSRLLACDGVAAFECGAGQGGAIAALMRRAGFADPAVYLDLAGHDRVVIAAPPRLPASQP